MMRKVREIFSNPGDPKHPIYKPVVGKDGVVDLEISGYENTDEIIQSYAESTDIRVILQRVAAGEVQLLNQRNAMFGDFTGMPKTYAEMLQLHINSNRLFESLPLDVRQQFNNDPNQFFAQAGNSEWFEKLDPILPAEMRSMNNKKSPGTEDPAPDPVE